MEAKNITGSNARENYFRRKFSLAQKPERAICRIFSDTGYELFINNRYVIKVSEWGNVRDYDLTPYFLEGENLIAVRAMNASGHRGFAFEIAADGKSILVSDRSWKMFPEERWGWFLRDYDDSAWGNAAELDLSAAGGATWFSLPGSDPAKVIPYLEACEFFTGEIPKCVDSPFFTAKKPARSVSEKTVLAAGEAYRKYVESETPDVSPARELRFCNPEDGTLAGTLEKLTVTAPKRYTGPSFVIDLGGNHVGFFRMRVESKGAVSFRLYHGETVPEALGEYPRDGVQNRMLREEYRIEAGSQEFEQRMRFGGRFLRVEFFDTPQEAVLSCFSFRNSLYPVQKRGYFHCDNAEINHLWEMGERTVHLCMQEYYLDAPKRDRMIWVGDTRFEALFNDYTFFDTALFEYCWDKVSKWQSPCGATRSAGGTTSSVLWDYVAWYVIAFQDYYMHTGNAEYLRKHKIHIEKAVDFLSSKAGDDGLIDVPANPLGKLWMVIVTNQTGKDTMMNLLYRRSLETAVMLEKALGDRAAEEKYAARLRKTAESCKTLPPLEEKPCNWRSVVPMYMMVEKKAQQSIPEAFQLFMQEFGKFGKNGSDTFAEGLHDAYLWPIEDASHPCSYGSFCHGWSASVLHFFPAYVAGIQPAEPGWKKVRVTPCPCGLKEFTCVVPTPMGEIILVYRNGKYDLTLPDGCERI